MFEEDDMFNQNRPEGAAPRENRRAEYVCGFRLNPYDGFTKSGFIMRRLLAFSVLLVFAVFSLILPEPSYLTIHQYLSRLFCRPVPNRGEHDDCKC